MAEILGLNPTYPTDAAELPSRLTATLESEFNRGGFVCRKPNARFAFLFSLFIYWFDQAQCMTDKFVGCLRYIPT